MSTPRVEQILDRLAEIRLALPGLADRSPAALRYLARELAELEAECAEWRAAWQEALTRCHALQRDLEEALPAGATAVGEPPVQE